MTSLSEQECKLETGFYHVDTNGKLSAESGTLFADPTLYRSMVGALQYLTFTRPDISYAVQQVCMHMHAPRSIHWDALKRIIRYIKGTSHYGLTLSNRQAIPYSPIPMQTGRVAHRSTLGYCVYYGSNLFSWSSKRQPTISRSKVSKLNTEGLPTPWPKFVG